ncbi:MAG TPA: nitrous oxide reductase accessory protein NosL [Chitinophagaceae bacterium]|nr:nitrous oxide reductase accessory protein NosL [Chitinophagaceae bacterium]
MNKMRTTSQILIALASLAFAATYFLPFWFIYLIAPQYPEGLTMNIWLNKITGQVEIINGLNHYIGMKHIKAEMFPEFKYLVYIIAILIAAGLLVAMLGKRKLLLAFLIVLALAGAGAMYDFWSWGYDYGHNLDPKAAIQVPGLFYQPPLIGHKTLLNFDAYSYPDTGGWVVVIATLVMIGVCAFEFYNARKTKEARLGKYNRQTALAVALLAILASCNAGPEKIAYGTDACADCRMTIMDPKFGGEVITKKGKVYKFDDAHCLAHFMRSGTVKETDVAQTVFIDYNANANFLKTPSLFFVVSPQLKSPMGSNAAAFSSQEAAAGKAAAVSGNIMDWQTLYTTLK